MILINACMIIISGISPNQEIANDPVIRDLVKLILQIKQKTNLFLLIYNFQC